MASLPNTRAATWFTDSHSTGLTLPGMIDDPAWSSGRRSSASPVDGPLASSRMSLAILVSADGEAAQPRRRLGQRALPALVDHRVARRAQRQAGLGGERGDHRGGEPGRSVDAGADGGAAERQLAEHVDVGPRAGERGIEQSRPRVGLLADRHRRGVHQVGAAGLDDVGGAGGERPQRVDERRDRGVDVVDELAGDGEADRRRHGVVGRLRRVDVVVGVDDGAVAEDAPRRSWRGPR